MRDDPSRPVLVISGHPHLAQLFQHHLEKFGQEVVLMNRWEEALQQAQTGEWAGVILDATEVGSAGLAQVRALRAALREPMVNILVVVERTEEAETLRPLLGAHNQCWSLWDFMRKVRQGKRAWDWPPDMAEQQGPARDERLPRLEKEPPEGVFSFFAHRRRRRSRPEEDDFPPEAA